MEECLLPPFLGATSKPIIRGGDIGGARGLEPPPPPPPPKKNNRLDGTIPRNPALIYSYVSWGLASQTCSAKHEAATRAQLKNEGEIFFRASPLHASMHCLWQCAIVLLAPPPPPPPTFQELSPPLIICH